jgi:CHAT domain-containing protein
MLCLASSRLAAAAIVASLFWPSAIVGEPKAADSRRATLEEAEEACKALDEERTKWTAEAVRSCRDLIERAGGPTGQEWVTGNEFGWLEQSRCMGVGEAQVPKPEHVYAGLIAYRPEPPSCDGQAHTPQSRQATFELSCATLLVLLEAARTSANNKAWAERVVGACHSSTYELDREVTKRWLQVCKKWNLKCPEVPAAGDVERAAQCMVVLADSGSGEVAPGGYCRPKPPPSSVSEEVLSQLSLCATGLDAVEDPPGQLAMITSSTCSAAWTLVPAVKVLADTSTTAIDFQEKTEGALSDLQQLIVLEADNTRKSREWSTSYELWRRYTTRVILVGLFQDGMSEYLKPAEECEPERLSRTKVEPGPEEIQIAKACRLSDRLEARALAAVILKKEQDLRSLEASVRTEPIEANLAYDYWQKVVGVTRVHQHERRRAALEQQLLAARRAANRDWIAQTQIALAREAITDGRHDVAQKTLDALPQSLEVGMGRSADILRARIALHRGRRSARFEQGSEHARSEGDSSVRWMRWAEALLAAPEQAGPLAIEALKADTTNDVDDITALFGLLTEVNFQGANVVSSPLLATGCANDPLCKVAADVIVACVLTRNLEKCAQDATEALSKTQSSAGAGPSRNGEAFQFQELRSLILRVLRLRLGDLLHRLETDEDDQATLGLLLKFHSILREEALFGGQDHDKRPMDWSEALGSQAKDLVVFVEPPVEDRDRYYAVIVDHATKRMHGVALGRRKEIDATAVRLRSDLARGAPTATIRSRQLFRLAFQPVQAHLPRRAGPVRGLVLVLDGELLHIPFYFLEGPNGPLIDDFELSVLPSLSALAPATNLKKGSVTIVVDPKNPGLIDDSRSANRRGLRRADFPLSALRWATQEAHALERRSGQSVVLKGPDAAASALLPFSPRGSVLHIATHGFSELRARDFRAIPESRRVGCAMDNALVLSSRTDETPCSGLLSADEILRSGSFWGTELVTLSACESGFGTTVPGVGSAGLRLAFLRTGAESVLSALWTVDDEQAYRFMDDFYAGLQANKSKAEAHRAAALARRKAHPERNEWAAFLLEGRPGGVHADWRPNGL